ncbi:hypothetical protein PRIPAC_73820 [Pristionchus pacificus]|uniref:Uncharacterized protein n=1 Tax=Pristionchus pacificus TaxID=54126 RepID=A0A454XKF6_PRIPA|nr:hypothetical protein PRIPAC_73820 [Pristionchus pacificus]|eukprot:PDM73413.1 hypothetical protein PRIPAC_40769 [Pristionchus pacificus]
MRGLELACLLAFAALALSSPLHNGVAHKRYVPRIASEVEIAELRELIKSGLEENSKLKVCGNRLFQLIRAFSEVPCTHEPAAFEIPDSFSLTDKCCYNECTYGELKNYLCMIYS